MNFLHEFVNGGTFAKNDQEFQGGYSQNFFRKFVIFFVTLGIKILRV